jgi:superfamily I DNA and/or RNA helicase
MTNAAGGPRTQQGKNVSSRNAIKVGLYSDSLLEGEDPNELEALRQTLVAQWGLSGSQGELLARDYVYSELKTGRLHQAQIAMVDAQMYNQDTRREFGKQAGISPIIYDSLPDWYFGKDDEPKSEAVRLTNALNEALHLKARYSLQAMLAARTSYPNLWWVIMGPKAINPKQSLGERLLAMFTKSSPEGNLQAFVDHHKKESIHEILWASNAQRFEAILRGLRAKFLIEMLSRADWAKVESAQHRKRLELTQLAHAIKREQRLVEVNTLTANGQETTLTVNANSEGQQE